MKYLLNFTLSAADRDALVEVLFGDIFGSREAMMSRELYMDRGADRRTGPRGFDRHARRTSTCRWGCSFARKRGGSLPSRFGCSTSGPDGGRSRLSYPYGSREASSLQVAAAAAEQGIELAFTMERAANRDLAAPLHLSRFDNNDLPGGKAARFELEEMFGTAPVRTWYTENDPVERSAVKTLGIIPARGGSKRLPRKNMRLLAGKPLVAWSIEAAQQARRLDRVVVSSDEPAVLELAAQYDKRLPLERPAEISRDDSPAIDFVRHALEVLERPAKARSRRS